MGIRSFDLRSFDHNDRFDREKKHTFLMFFPLFITKDRIAPVDLRSLIFFKDRWDRFALIDHDRSDLSITKYDRFDRKTDDRIPNPDFICVTEICME